jgi:CRISPR-associated exonuclease Cas4
MWIAFVLLALALLVFFLSLRLRRQTGLPHGQVIYSDTTEWLRNEHALFSKRHRLSGKPDYLIRDGESIIPVEVKSGKAPPQPREGHVLQLAAYSLLVEENFGATVERGIVKYDDKQFEIAFTPELRAELLRVIDEMRSCFSEGDAHRNHNDAWRCRSCGVRDTCDERIEQ